MEDGLEFGAFISTGSKLVNDCAENFHSKQVRKALGQLSAYLENHGELTESSILAFCSNISTWFRLLSGFPKYRKLVLKSLIHFWSSSPENIRLHAALALHKFCKNFPSQHEVCAKKMYLAFVKSCKSISAHNIHILSLMTNSLVEIFTINSDKMACLVFSSIRKLAEIVRVAIKDSSKDNLKKVFSWPFCAAIKLWCLFLEKADSKKLDSLIAPTISICMELCCFQVTNFYAPFYLQMVRIALSLMQKKQIFIPVNHVLGHLLKTICSKKVVTSGKITGNAYCVSFMIKASTSDQANVSYREALFDDCHTLLMKYIEISSTWACFPEIGLNCQNLLTAAISECPNKKFKSSLAISKNKLNTLLDAALKARADCELPANSYDINHIQENFAPIDFKSYVNSLDSVQKLKEEQAEHIISKSKTSANNANKLNNNNNSKSKSKLQSLPKSKSLKKKINVDMVEDQLVNFEL